jgi:putative sigma-54 modulation protein
MNVIFKGRHRDIAPAIREYAEEKVGKVAKVLDSMVMETEIEFQTEKNPSIENNQVVEVTMYTKGPVIRAREAAPTEMAAIDLVTEKLERQVKKLKGKILHKHTGRGAEVIALADMPEVQPGPEPTVVRTKVIEVKPMTEDEAILQLELLNHDFFVFASADSEEINVLYRRNDGDYGLIAPKLGD